jgi:acyl-CoA thioesterase
MAGFVDATKVAPGAAAATYEARLDSQWTVTGRPNGGYLLAVLARAAGQALDDVGHPHPLAASAHFLDGAAVGPATVTIDRLRTGRTISQVRARLEQDGRQCMEALLTMGRLHPAAGPYWSGEPPVRIPAPADCVRIPAQPPGLDFRIDMLDAIELRLDPVGLGYTRGRPDQSGELRGWLRFIDEMPPDPVSLLYVADALPPATLTIHPSGWVPTLELTVYVRALPAPGPLRVRQRARLVQVSPGSAGGLVDQACDIWDSRDRLVAQATQLASVRFTPGPA